jgi:hypothetical protein
MCVYMHSFLVENHLIQILEDEPLISEVVLSHIYIYIYILKYVVKEINLLFLNCV